MIWQLIPIQLAPKRPLNLRELCSEKPSALTAVPWKSQCRALSLQWISLSHHCLSCCFFISRRKSCTGVQTGPAPATSCMRDFGLWPACSEAVHPPGVQTENWWSGFTPQTLDSGCYISLSGKVPLAVWFCSFPWVDQLPSNCRKFFSKIRYFYCRNTM